MPTNSKEYMKKNYKKYWGHPSAVADRSARNSARRIMAKKGLGKKGDGKEVDHKNGVKAGNGMSNLRVLAMKTNRQLGQKKATKSRKQ